MLENMHMRKYSAPPKTPLQALLRSLTQPQRDQLAAWAGTSVTYLQALGSCARCSCRADLAMRIHAATERLHKRTRGKTLVITVAELATMCKGI